MRISHPAIKAATEVRFTAAAGGVAFPSTSVLDTFTDTDATTLPNHDPDGTPGVGTWVAVLEDGGAASIVSNQCVFADGGADYYQYHWNISYGPRSEAFWTIPTLQQGTGLYAGVMTRLTTNVSSTVDGYWMGWTPNILHVQRIDDGAGTDLDTVSHTFSAGEQLGGRSDGNTHTVYINGTEMASADDSSYTSANVLGWSAGRESDTGTNWAFDDFGGGTMP